MTKKTRDVSKSDNTHWPSLRRLTTAKAPLSGVPYDCWEVSHRPEKDTYEELKVKY